MSQTGSTERLLPASGPDLNLPKQLPLSDEAPSAPAARAIPIGDEAKAEKFFEVVSKQLYQFEDKMGEIELKEEQLSFAQKHITPVMLGLCTTAAMNTTVMPAFLEKIPALQTFAEEVAKYFVKMPQWTGDMMIAANGLNMVRAYRHPKDINPNVNAFGKVITHMTAAAIVYYFYRAALALHNESPDPQQIPVPPYMILDPAINLLNLVVQTAGTSLLQRPLEFTFGPVLSQLKRPVSWVLGCVAMPFSYCASKVSCNFKLSTPDSVQMVKAHAAAACEKVSGVYSYVKNSIFGCNSYFNNSDAKPVEQQKLKVSIKKLT